LRLIGLLFSIALVSASHAADLQCQEASGTLSTYCIQPSAVRANGELRSAPLLSGGPRQVDQTGYTLVTNCSTSISTLQDRQGKNFGGGRNSDTPMIGALSSFLCAVGKPKRDPTLRQF
jgi:hypothetical protein